MRRTKVLTFDFMTRTIAMGAHRHCCYMHTHREALGNNITGCMRDKCLDFHHLVENTVSNRKRYGDRIQGELNCVVLCRNCHEKYVHKLNDLKEALIDTWNHEISLEK